MKKYKTIRFPSFKLSFLVEKKVVLAIIALFIALIAISIVNIGVGTLYISPLEIIKVLLGFDEMNYSIVIWEFRLPRLILACLVGAALALSGVILQGVIRNPLASPDIIGINSGASVMAVLFLAFLNEKISIGWMPLFALSGAFIVAFVIYFGAWRKGISPLRIVLVGFAVTSLVEACKTLFLIYGPIWRTSQAQVWLTGTIYGATWQDVFLLLPWLILALPVLFVLTSKLNIQMLGDELAIGLGGRLELQRIILVGISAGLAGVAIAFAGSIGFIGLMAPHIARRFVGGSNGGLFIASAIIGAILLVCADLLGRVILPPRDIPAGVFVSVVGAPVFLYLLIKVQRKPV